MDDQDDNHDNLILPNSTFVVFWSLIYSILIFAYFGIAVFEIAFQTSINKIFNKSYFAAALLVYCIVDTLIFLNISIILEGRLINNRYKNFTHYIKTYLIFTDVLVIIILVVRISLGIVDQSQYFVVLSVLDLLIILKFLNIRQYQQMLKLYYFNQWSILIFEFVKNLILLAFLCHIVGSAFFLIDVSLIESGWYPISEHWLISASAMPNLYSAPLQEQYLYSIYFAIVTLSTIAYGDITPLNQTEVAYVIGILTFLLMFYVYIFTQIYDAVNWFTRKSNQIKQQKYKLAKFMKRFNISTVLSGRIVSHFEYRETQYKKIDKEIFLNQLSRKMARLYQSLPLKNQHTHFIPKFVKRIELQASLIYSALSQRFYNPEQQFSPIEASNQIFQRIMYYVPANLVVYRKMYAGVSLIVQKAKKNNWLGLNAFFTCQHDQNQKWSVEYPSELIAMKFSDFIDLIRHDQKPYQKFLQECHTSICSGENMQDRNKCLLCWQGYHHSKRCTSYRPEFDGNSKIYVLESFNVLQFNQMITNKQRKKFNRRSHKLKRIFNQPPLTIPPEDKSTQTELFDSGSKFLKYRKIFALKDQESVANWIYYIPQFNISEYGRQVRESQKLSEAQK